MATAKINLFKIVQITIFAQKHPCNLILKDKSNFKWAESIIQSWNVSQMNCSWDGKADSSWVCVFGHFLMASQCCWHAPQAVGGGQQNRSPLLPRETPSASTRRDNRPITPQLLQQSLNSELQLLFSLSDFEKGQISHGARLHFKKGQFRELSRSEVVIITVSKYYFWEALDMRILSVIKKVL